MFKCTVFSYILGLLPLPFFLLLFVFLFLLFLTSEKIDIDIVVPLCFPSRKLLLAKVMRRTAVDSNEVEASCKRFVSYSHSFQVRDSCVCNSAPRKCDLVTKN